MKNQTIDPRYTLTGTGKRLVTKHTVLAIILGLLLILPQNQALALSLTITTNYGSVTATPDKADYDLGEVVELITKPDTGYCFSHWSGDAEGKRLVLNLTMDTDKAITANFKTWEPPIGIPMPEFGIFETHYMYQDQTYDFGSGPEPYKDAGDGPYTHYVDNTHPNATDTGNPYGTKDTPKVSFPSQSTIGPGAVVEMHGGPYSFGWFNLGISGTQTQPVFIRGASGASIDEMPLISSGDIYISGHYVIIENIKDSAGLTVRAFTADGETHHVSIRSCESDAGMRAVSWAEGGIAEDVVFYNNHIHHYNMIPPDENFERDSVGVGIKERTNRVWIVDNHIHHNSGDCIGAGHAAQYTATNYYIGRNILHDTSENAIDLKEMENVIVSENIMYNYAGGSAGSGGGGTVLVAHYGPTYSPKNVWILYNEMYNANLTGIQVGGDQRYPVYIIGNIIHDIQNGIVAAYMFESFDENGFIFPRLLTKGYVNQEGEVDPGFTGLDAEFRSWFPLGYDQFTYIEDVLNNALNSQETARGYRTWNCDEVYMFNNVFYNVDNGMDSGTPGSVPLLLHNNIISEVSDHGYHISLEHSDHRAASEISHNMFHQPGGEVRIIWGGTTYNLAEFQANTGKGEGCLEADPLFVSPEKNDFSLQASSPAIDAGIEHSIYQLFQDTFGLDIRVDYEGRTRPQGSAWDIGAYEYTETTFLYGDVNENEEVTATDAALAARYAVGLITLTAEQITKADVTGTSGVTATDAAWIARKAVGLIDRFPVE